MGKHKRKGKNKKTNQIRSYSKDNKFSCNKDRDIFSKADRKFSWFSRLINFCTNPKVALIITVVGIVVTFISIVQWFIPNKNASSASVATRNYEHGLIALEDGNLQDAEKYFATAYSISNNLLDVKYYYAYTEYLLKNYDKSHKILQENRTSLNADEMALYAMFEIKNGHIERCQEYLNKISRPERLKNFSFRAYVVASTQLGFSLSYANGITQYILNADLLNKKIAECHILPHLETLITIVVGTEVDFELIDDAYFRIESDEYSDSISFNYCKLLLHLFLYMYSVQYEIWSMPMFYFSDAAEYFDYENYHDLSLLFLEFMVLYTCEVELDAEYLERVVEAYEIICEEYDDLISLEEEKGNEIIEADDRKLFEMCKQILDDFNNNCFDPSQYRIGSIFEDDESDIMIVKRPPKSLCKRR